MSVERFLIGFHHFDYSHVIDLFRPCVNEYLFLHGVSIESPFASSISELAFARSCSHGYRESRLARNDNGLTGKTIHDKSHYTSSFGHIVRTNRTMIRSASHCRSLDFGQCADKPVERRRRDVAVARRMTAPRLVRSTLARH